MGCDELQPISLQAVSCIEDQRLTVSSATCGLQHVVVGQDDQDIVAFAVNVTS
jgi:hypothetical protein